MKPRHQQIIQEVAAMHGVPVFELERMHGKRELCHARQLAMFAIRSLCGSSLPNIARSFVGRDTRYPNHTTVMYAIKMAAEREQTGHLMEALVTRLNGARA